MDELKCVTRLGQFPLPVEVLPLARSYVARQLVRLTRGQPILRPNLVTDSGNLILDVLSPQLDDPLQLEQSLKLISGVVEVGLFAHRRPDHLLIGRAAA